MSTSVPHSKRIRHLDPEEPRTLCDFVLRLLTARADKHLDKLPDHIHGAAVDASDLHLQALVSRSSHVITKFEGELDALVTELEKAAGSAARWRASEAAE